jgi:hypothetical protein
MIEPTDSNIHPIDSLIERTLARDAEATRNRFLAVPNAPLTAKLALSTASHGLLGSIGAKLALYAGGALLIGSAAYFIPSLGQHPAVPPAMPAAQHRSPAATADTKMNIATEPVAPRPASATQNIRSTSPSPILKLDEGNGKNIPRITNPKYEGPLK